MAEPSPTVMRSDPGARVAKDAIDPELIKLKRAPSKVSVITAAGVVFLSAMFLVRLHGDRTFSGDDAPQSVAVADIVADKVAPHSYVTIVGEPMMSHAIRTALSKPGIGLRVVPIRGTTDRLWIVIHGDGWDPPNVAGYTGRLRKLDDLPFIDALRAYTSAHPRPLFATIGEARNAFVTNEVLMVSGDRVALDPSDRIAFDLLDPNAAHVIAAVNERHASATAWRDALTAAGLTLGQPLTVAGGPTSADGTPSQVRFEIAMPDAVAAVTSKLEAAGLWAARVEPITRHHEMTWGELRGSHAQATPDSLMIAGKLVTNTSIGLVGFYVAKTIPDGAYAVITGEKPQDYWHVWPITIALALIFLVFAWALVRAVKRDMLSPPARPS